jgi:hypothetical protein
VLAIHVGRSLNLPTLAFPVGLGVFCHFVSLVGASMSIAGVRPGYYMPWSFAPRAQRVSGTGMEHLLLVLTATSVMALLILWGSRRCSTGRGRGRTLQKEGH